MGQLRFGMMVSLDGYINDRKGKFDWGQVSEEVHRFAERVQAREGLTIYGRRMFETMAVWDTLDQDQTIPQFERDFSRIWQQTEKVVVSRSLDAVTTKNTRLVRELSADEMRKLKADTAEDVSVSGPTLAATFLKQGLVDEVSIYYVPVVVGGGTPMFPNVIEMLKFELMEERRFANGLVFVRHRVLN
jgi:dihydrofolate reductase